MLDHLALQKLLAHLKEPPSVESAIATITPPLKEMVEVSGLGESDLLLLAKTIGEYLYSRIQEGHSSLNEEDCQDIKQALLALPIVPPIRPKIGSFMRESLKKLPGL